MKFHLLLLQAIYIYEGEDLEVLDSSGEDTWVSQDAKAGNGAYRYFMAADVNSFIEYKIDVQQAGTYKIIVVSRDYNNRAIVQLLIDGKQQGDYEDNYSENAQYIEHDFGITTFDTAGEKKLRFVAKGKNNNSQGFRMDIDYIKIEEAELPNNLSDITAFSVNGQIGETIIDKDKKIITANLRIFPFEPVPGDNKHLCRLPGN